MLLQDADHFETEMASTGEIASFGTDRWEAYWAGKHQYSNHSHPLSY